MKQVAHRGWLWLQLLAGAVLLSIALVQLTADAPGRWFGTLTAGGMFMSGYLAESLSAQERPASRLFHWTSLLCAVGLVVVSIR